jgi:threonine synthase
VTAPVTTSRVVCAGCGHHASSDDPYPFRCPNAGTDDADHVMSRLLETGGARFADLVDDDPNPFVRYRRLFHSWHVATSRGMPDGDYVDLVRRLDKEVAGVDGSGFTVTPFARLGQFSEGSAFGPEVWVKDETGNVSGSHKARHMMGLLVYLEVVELLGLARAGSGAPPLAIASCGNAALAAAVVARAGQRTLRVFVPTWGDPGVIARLQDLRAEVNVIPREEGVPGDPTFHAMQRAIRGGALPFTCQGNENGLVIEGGQTIAYEMASQLNEANGDLDAVFVQVGGGALASAVVQGFRESVQLGAVSRMPRVYTVQTLGAHPLKRAYDRLRERIVDRLMSSGRTGHPHVPFYIAEWFASPEVQEELTYARTHRSEFMWPWEKEPKSIAHGILDDETYDWFQVVRGMLETGGQPVLVDEETLRAANDLARSATDIDVDHTGSSGLAGLLELGRAAFRADERAAVLFTGVRRAREGRER